MTAPLRRLWWELIRPRGHVRHRFYRVGRSSRAGVALLMVLSSIMLLTVLVTEIARGATVRMQLAAHHRDEVAAEALAHTGINFYRLVLMASKELGKNPFIMQAGEMLGINSDSLWQLVPFVNTQLMRLVFVKEGDVDNKDLHRMQAQGLTDAQKEESREGGTAFRRNFLDFDGDFSANVEDASRYIYVGKFQASTFADLLELETTKQLRGLMNREEVRDYFYEEDIDPLELVGNLADWTDRDSTRLYQGGDENAIYDRLETPYRPKNAPFDTPGEMRLVDGWHLDGVWRRLGRHLTIFGDGKINVNSAQPTVLRALLSAYADGVYSEQYIDEALAELVRMRNMPRLEGGLFFSNAQSFKNAVENQIQANLPLKDEIVRAVTTESFIFRVESLGEVGGAKVRIRCVLDFSQDPTGRIVYWKVE